MITLFTGSPGAGKTASLVDLLSKLEGGRPLYVDGLNGLTLPHTPCDSNNWHTELPDGAILVIDEVQRVWRARSSGSKVPDSVAELETHRHRGIDVYLTTQAPALVDPNVRNLVGRHIHIRDTGIMGRWWYEWPETSVGMQWKTCINKRRISLPKKSFELYKSSSLHTTPVRGIPRALIYGIFALLLFFALAFGVYRIYKKTQAPESVPIPEMSGSRPGIAAQPFTPEQQRQPFIDDRVDFIPRVSNKPESAPAYDHLRVILSMPVVTGGMCIGDQCTCITDQGTKAGLSPVECKEFVMNPPFNPYRPPASAAVPAQSQQPSTPPPYPVASL